MKLTKQQRLKLVSAREYESSKRITRIDNLFSQKIMALRLGINRATFNRYERGLRHPPQALLTKWCSILGVTLEITPEKIKVG